jgi:hypothetical protein
MNGLRTVLELFIQATVLIRRQFVQYAQMSARFCFPWTYDSQSFPRQTKKLTTYVITKGGTIR